MSLDQNLFTLNFNPRDKEPHVVDLIDPSGIVHYRKERSDDEGYSFCLFGMLMSFCIANISNRDIHLPHTHKLDSFDDTV